MTEREASALANASVVVPMTLPALRREWNQAKAAVAPWWAENSKEAYNSGLDSLARGLSAYYDSASGKRKGPPVGYPRRHRKGRRDSFRITTGCFGLVDHRHIRLPRIGVIRTKERTTKLAERLEAGKARILSATLSTKGDRWFISFGCQVNRASHPVPSGAAVGVDVGVKNLAVLSNGKVIPNPRHGARYARRQARLQRECARRRGPAKGRPPSGRWARSKTALAASHRRVANARRDGTHKCSTNLARTHSVIVIEDLAVKNMTASARGSGNWRGKAGLNRAILDTSPAELRAQLAYKTSWYGSSLLVADRWYPSSKTCSRCGTLKAKLSLSERTYCCEACGAVIDRDLNAAANLASLVEATINPGTASGAGTGQVSLAYGRGEERLQAGSPSRCSSENRQDGTSTLDKTVTATPHRVAPEPALVGSDR